MRVLSVLVVALVVCSFAGDAAASRSHERAVGKHGRAKKSGKLSAFASRRVNLGKGSVRLDQVVKKGLGDQKSLARELRRAGKGIRGSVVETEEVSELADRFVVTRRTGAVVVDPKAVSRVSRRYANALRNRKRKTVAQLDAKSRAGIAKAVKKARKLPKGHPMRDAVDKGGDQGLLDAIAEGKGYWGVSETWSILKKAPKVRTSKRITSGPARFKQPTARPAPKRTRTPRVRVPSRKKKPRKTPRVRVPGKKRPRVRLPGKRRRRSLDPGSIEVIPLGPEDDDPFGLFPDDEQPLLPEEDPSAPLWGAPILAATTSTGREAHDFKLLSGFTAERTWEYTYILGDDEWLETYFKLYFYAQAGVGMRFPLEGTATLDPKNITVTGNSDRRVQFKTEITVNTKDGATRFYEDVGLGPNKRFDGKELVLQAEVVVHAYVYLGGSLWWQKRFGEGIDQGTHFQPPQSETWQHIKNFWVPASVTNTDWTIGGYGITGQIGAKLEGNGMPMIDVRARANGQSINSWLGAEDESDARATNTIRFPNRNGQRNLRANTTGSCNNSCTKTYGYRIFNASYDANFRVTPGIKLSGYLGFPIYESLSRTLWLHGLALDLGSYVFGPHDGTTDAVMRNSGTKTFTKQ